MSQPIPYPDPPLRGDGLVLRPFCASDAAAASALAEGVDELRFVEQFPELEDSDLEELAERQRLDGTVLQLVIADAEDDRYLGEVSIVMLDAGAAELGCAVVSWARGRGLARTAFRLASDWALGSLGLRRVQATVHPDNEAALRLAEGAGYRREGVMRAYWAADGEPLDAVLLARLPDDPVV